MTRPRSIELLSPTADISVEIVAETIAVVEINRPPNNFFDVPLLQQIGGIYRQVDQRNDVRVIVLAAQGKHFCAGADFAGTSGVEEVSADEGAKALYKAAVELFSTKTPIIAAVQGAAVGGGLGLALSADFRVGSPESRFAANFARLGFHQGFGLSVTLPRVVGNQRAAELLMTGRRIDGLEAERIGILDRLVESNKIRDTAIEFASELAAAAPLAVGSIRATLRHGLVNQIAAATVHERNEQAWLRDTADFAEGVQAASERREPHFRGR